MLLAEGSWAGRSLRRTTSAATGCLFLSSAERARPAHVRSALIATLFGSATNVATLAFAASVCGWLASAQRAPDAPDQSEASPSLPDKPPGAFKPDADAGEAAQPDVWIFSGSLQDSHETFSGTLVANKGEAQFEMKLASGATCDGSDLSGTVGLVRLKEITCSDDRVLKALFVPQGGQQLKVFGHVGDERFVTSAHLLGTEAIPDKKQTAEPTAPALKDAPGGKTPPQ